MEGLDAWAGGTASILQPERSEATRAGVFAGACSDCGPALRYSAGPRVARNPVVAEHDL